MRSMLRPLTHLLLILALLGLPLVAGCEQAEDAGEETVDAMEEAGEEAEDMAEDTAEDVKDAAEEAGDEIEDAVD